MYFFRIQYHATTHHPTQSQQDFIAIDLETETKTTQTQAHPRTHPVPGQPQREALHMLHLQPQLPPADPPHPPRQALLSRDAHLQVLHVLQEVQPPLDAALAHEHAHGRNAVYVQGVRARVQGPVDA